MPSSTSKSTVSLSPLLMALFLDLLLLLSLCFSPSSSDARILRPTAAPTCIFRTLFRFGEGKTSLLHGLDLPRGHVSSSAGLPSPVFKNALFGSDSSFAAPGAVVMSPDRSLPGPCFPIAGEAPGDSVLRERAGENDYKLAFKNGKSVGEVGRMVPEVVSAIKEQLKRLIGAGAVNLVVSGVPGPEDRRGAEGMEMFGRLHDDHLQQALVELKTEFPEVDIVYGNLEKMTEDGGHWALQSSHSAACKHSGRRRKAFLVR
ncbi:hypothetical protein DM860_015783 [Cuscuta australis]|uniref:SGNH hydrolase-type esterase domain-containing protein n=1 Tax=Cuscuta australis TaxID=267555 RepID=A0A328DZI4_9ASTE|nr:hypothetical protein DM860_015783 [Cuscuta australis]